MSSKKKKKSEITLLLSHKHVNRKHRTLRHAFRNDKAFQFSGKLNTCLMKRYKEKAQESESCALEKPTETAGEGIEKIFRVSIKGIL